MMTAVTASVFTLTILVALWLFNSNQCGTEISLELNKIEPQLIAYTKTTYQVEQNWVVLGDEMETRLSAFVYFPVTAENEELSDLLPHKEWQQQHIQTIRKKIGDTLAVKMATARMQLAKNGKILPQKFPLLLFGPGLGWLPTDYASFLASMASRGFVVVAFTGLPISKTIYYPDGTSQTVENVKVDYQKMSEYFDFAIKHLTNSNPESENHYSSMMDTDKIYVAGHSVSGAAALMVAQKNDKVKGIINLDGDVTKDFVQIQPLQPILYITTQPQGADSPKTETWSEDRSEKRRNNAFIQNAGRSQKSVRIKIPQMYHLDFLDVAQFKKNICKECNRKNFGSVEYQKSNELIQNVIFDFVQNQDNWKNLSEKYNVLIQVK